MSYFLLAFNISKDKRPDLQKDVLGLENDL
jgi:hypothetical protein